MIWWNVPGTEVWVLGVIEMDMSVWTPSGLATEGLDTRQEAGIYRWFEQGSCRCFAVSFASYFWKVFVEAEQHNL